MDFDYNKKYEIGDVISPFDNSSNKWYKTKFWIVITNVDSKKKAQSWHYSYSKESAELYSMIIKLKEEIKQ